MANKKITQLPSSTGVTLETIIPVVIDGQTEQTTLQSLETLFDDSDLYNQITGLDNVALSGLTGIETLALAQTGTTSAYQITLEDLKRLFIDTPYGNGIVFVGESRDFEANDEGKLIVVGSDSGEVILTMPEGQIFQGGKTSLVFLTAGGYQTVPDSNIIYPFIKQGSANDNNTQGQFLQFLSYYDDEKLESGLALLSSSDGYILDPADNTKSLTTIKYLFDKVASLTASTGSDSLFTSGSSGNYSIKVINDTETDATGNYSTAFGISNSASGTSSFAIGTGTHAEGENSFASGNLTTASGVNSHAEGYQSTASNFTSHAEGFQTTANGINSHSEGALTVASGNYSHAQNYQTTASGEHSTAIGYGSTASGYGSFAYGGSRDRYDENFIAGGTASGIGSFAGGGLCIASGKDSVALGSAAIASGAGSFAMGGTEGGDNESHTTASGLGAFAIGFGSVASGDQSFAGGGDYGNSDITGGIASGHNSFAFGPGSRATNSYCTAIGFAAESNGYNTTVIGNGIVGNADGTLYINKLNVLSLPAYDDESAATSDGLETGTIYRTTGSGSAPLNVAGILMIKL